MTAHHRDSTGGFLAEVGSILSRAKQVWRLLSPAHQRALAIAGIIMALVSGCNTAFPILLGQLLDGVKSGTDQALPVDGMYWVVGKWLILIAGIFLLREILQVTRRIFVESACTQIDKTMTVQVFSHLIRMDLSALTQDKIGAMQGRISRSVVGFVRFIRLAFLDFFPPILTGIFALITAKLASMRRSCKCRASTKELSRNVGQTFPEASGSALLWRACF